MLINQSRPDFCVGLVYVSAAASLAALLAANAVFAAVTLGYWAQVGLQDLLEGKNLAERIWFSQYFRYILAADALWLSAALVLALRRRQFRTADAYYLRSEPLRDPDVCVVIPAFNESGSISSVVSDFAGRRHVSRVIVVDNCSSDGTAELARRAGAQVLAKERNTGYANSCVEGLAAALEAGPDLVVLAEADGTFRGADVDKMVSYMGECDMAVGTRCVQAMSERGTQNSSFYVWGNWFLAKLLQLKYFSLDHMGSVRLTDVGCAYRCVRAGALRSIMGDLGGESGADRRAEGGNFALFMTMAALERGLRVVEIPVSFCRRVGESKTGSDKKGRGFAYGLRFLWLILRA